MSFLDIFKSYRNLREDTAELKRESEKRRLLDNGFLRVHTKDDVVKILRATQKHAHHEDYISWCMNQVGKNGYR